MTPDARQLRKARERFASLLDKPNTRETVWQSFFAENPFVLSTGLPLKLMPQDILPLGRQGRSEPDLIFYPRHTPPTHTSYGVIELKRPDHLILTFPRQNIVTLSRNAATAVAQGEKYLTELDHANIIKPPNRNLFLGTPAYVFIIMGLTKELEVALVSGLIQESFKQLLPPNFQIIPYDHLYRMFSANVPPHFMLAVPCFISPEANLTILLESLIEVHEYEGPELGGYDSNLQSYYASCYSVTRNTAAFEAIKAIAKSSPGALSQRNRLLLKEMKHRLDFRPTTSTLHPETSYLSDLDSLKQAEQELTIILREVEELFGKGDIPE